MRGWTVVGGALVALSMAGCSQARGAWNSVVACVSPCDPAPAACAPAPAPECEPCPPRWSYPVYSGGCAGDPGIGRDGTGAFAPR
jgi:hypothetical protein